MTATHRWVVHPTLVWTSFDGESDWLVYNPESADIHLISDAARTLCRLIQERPQLTETELVPALAGALNRPEDDALTSATREMLASMDRVGMIRPAE